MEEYESKMEELQEKEETLRAERGGTGEEKEEDRKGDKRRVYWLSSPHSRGNISTGRKAEKRGKIESGGVSKS